MDADQWWLLFVMLFSSAFLAFLVLVVVPSLAQDRLVLTMSSIRTRLGELDGKRLNEVERDALVHIDRLAESILIEGAPPVRFLVAASFLFRRQARAGRLPKRIPNPCDHLRLAEGCAHRLEIEKLERKALRETMQASFLGSRFWWFLWPFGLIAKHLLADTTSAQPESAAEARVDRVEFTVVEAVQIRMQAPSERMLVPA